MNSLIDDTTTETVVEESFPVARVNAAGIPAPRATHEEAHLPDVPADNIAPPKFNFPTPPGYEPVEWDGTETNLPTGKALATLRAIYLRSIVFHNRAFHVEFLRRGAIVRKAVIAAEQGSPVIQNCRPVYDRERHKGRAETRADIIAKLDALLTSGELDTAPMTIKPGGNPLIYRAVVYDDGKNNFLPILLFKGRKAVADYAGVFYKQWNKINYKDRIDEIRLELSLSGSLSAQRLDELQAELSRLESSSSEILVQAASAKVFEAYNAVQETSINLLDNLIEVLESHRLAAVESEKSFFTSHGAAHESTAVSRQWDAVIKSTRDMLARLKSPQGHVSMHHSPNPSQTAITGFFGLEIIPGVL